MSVPAMCVADLRVLRSYAKSIIGQCEARIDALGEGADRHAEVLIRSACVAIVSVIDVYESATAPSNEIPPRIKRALDDYAELGLRTGDCLYALLTNDLRGAFARADPETAAAMPAIMTYVCSCLPSGCWGSPAAVDAWIRRARS